VARDTPEPSPLCHEILNARPYAFLDDAPLEERRTQSIYTRRAGETTQPNDIGALDRAAIDRVRDEARPDPREADELHDGLLTAGYRTESEAAAIPSALFEELASRRRATRVRIPNPESQTPSVWCTAERLCEIRAVHAVAAVDPEVVTPVTR